MNKLKDIKEFAIGKVAVQHSTGFRYEVIEYIYGIKKGKRQILSSRCTNLDTGNEVIITWNKNKCFI